MSKRLLVLVIDDDRGMQSVLKRGLERQGHFGLIATDSAEAIRILEEQEPDVVLLDLHLPGTTGKLLYRKMLDRRPALKDRVIVMSGDVETSKDAAWFANQGLPVLSKPFELDQLVATLGRFSAADPE